MSNDRPASEAAPIGSRRLALAVSAVVFVVAGGLAELSVRKLRPEWRPPPARGLAFLRPDPRLGWRLREGRHGPFTLPHRTTQVAISAQGLRDDSYAPYPASGRRRVLLLGDSFAWGFGVEKQEMFEKLLEDRFPDLDVVNAIPSQSFEWTEAACASKTFRCPEGGSTSWECGRSVEASSCTSSGEEPWSPRRIFTRLRSWHGT